MSDGSLDEREAFREADPQELDAHMRASLDGFHQGGLASEHAFFVREPDARWVARNLIDTMRYEEVPGGIRVRVVTAGLPRLARYVVGLGGAAKPLTSELESAVASLARGALEAIAATRPASGGVIPQ